MSEKVEISEEGKKVVEKTIDKLRRDFPDDEIKKLEKKLRGLRKKYGKSLKGAKKRAGSSLEIGEDEELKAAEKELKKESKGIFRRAWEGIKDAVSYVFGKITGAVKWFLNLIVDHPILTILVLLIGAGIYYYSGPMAAGYSAMAETAAEITEGVAAETLDVGETISVGDAVINAGGDVPLFIY